MEIVQASRLVKEYPKCRAVAGISFDVREAEVFGLLGPNGAGKTTTVEMLEGVTPRTGGELRVLGVDPERHSRMLRDRIGVCLQETNLPGKIKVREAVELFLSLYSRRAPVRPLLERFQLWEKRDTLYSELSGGQKQRLALSFALVNDPRLLFLDEPTAGLDPQARHAIHALIQELRAERRTVVLTTHYIEEAEALCDRVAIIDRGRIVARGTPKELQARASGKSSLTVQCTRQLPMPDLLAEPWASGMVPDTGGTRVTVTVARPAETLVRLLAWIDQRDIPVCDVRMTQPSLEDVFIELTGKALRE